MDSCLLTMQGSASQLFPGLLSLSSCSVVSNSFVIPWTLTHQILSSVHEISQAKILEWVGHFLLQGIFQAQGLNLSLLHWQVGSLPLESPGEPVLPGYFLPIRCMFGEGNDTPLQYFCLENPTGRGAWWAAVHEVVKSRTQLRDFTFTFHFPALEKEMATHCSVLAWRMPGMGEPGGLPSMGSHRVRHD